MRFLVLFLLLLPALSLAGPDEAAETDATAAAKVVEIDFEALEVYAPLYKPGGVYIGLRKAANFAPMFELRESWAREIRESTVEVR